jgi:hypothetical protein
MTDHPVIFSAPMILALLAGRKTQTRRLAYRPCKACGAPGTCEHERRTSPWRNVKAGDRLWVRESLKSDRMENFLSGERTTNAIVAYYAADDSECVEQSGFNLAWIWEKTKLPSIHMPRTFCRLTLIVTATKVERVQYISNEDAMAEGIESRMADVISMRWPAYFGDPSIASDTPKEAFAALWSMIHGTDSWNANPEVVALTFRVIKANIDSQAAREVA